MLDSLTGSDKDSTPDTDEDTQLVIDVYGAYETARSAARHAIEHRQPADAAAEEMAPATEWAAMNACWIGLFPVQGALCGAVETLQQRGVTADAVSPVPDPGAGGWTDAAHDHATAVRWVTDALERNSDARDIDLMVAESLEGPGLTGDLRIRELLVEIIDVASAAASSARGDQ
ncbi:hypothetical protein DOU17_01260 [Clavibacter michiganensis subsp. michiganensis]|uniref:hypothetical protein n=1 Tax=Clavibacter michiganensis TaxID=28447 RepID=UPI000B668FBA|nr:hypothetical protein [Clavibacter michiganensis]MWJ17572.1 hypothetical protein [Clavibacter michiganensis subsp. michiganensis]OUE00169.1 hypothetical protein CMMCAS06_00430 [Clavibacter michiganensis subsp. michiganensis]OUE01068.1 hypothetical protein CMMCAS08_15520 [Clavibacter michiganensis subsp. michiganensis]